MVMAPLEGQNLAWKRRPPSARGPNGAVLALCPSVSSSLSSNSCPLHDHYQQQLASSSSSATTATTILTSPAVLVGAPPPLSAPFSSASMCAAVSPTSGMEALAALAAVATATRNAGLQVPVTGMSPFMACDNSNSNHRESMLTPSTTHTITSSSSCGRDGSSYRNSATCCSEVAVISGTSVTPVASQSLSASPALLTSASHLHYHDRQQQQHHCCMPDATMITTTPTSVVSLDHDDNNKYYSTSARPLFASPAGTTTNKMHYRYVVLSLERPEEVPNWGFSIALMQPGHHVVIGHVRNSDSGNHHHNNIGLRHYVKGYWSSYSPVRPDVFYNNQVGDMDTPLAYTRSKVTEFIQSLTQQPCCVSTARTLLPGDCIVACHSRPVSSYVHLHEITDALRQSRHMTIIVWRNDRAIQQAHDVWQQCMPPTTPSQQQQQPTVPSFHLPQPHVRNNDNIHPSITDVAYLAAKAAHHVLLACRSCGDDQPASNLMMQQQQQLCGHCDGFATHNCSFMIPTSTNINTTTSSNPRALFDTNRPALATAPSSNRNYFRPWQEGADRDAPYIRLLAATATATSSLLSQQQQYKQNPPTRGMSSGTTARTVAQNRKRIKNAVTTTTHRSSPPDSCLRRYGGTVNPLFLESPAMNNSRTPQPIVYDDSIVDFVHTWDPDEGTRAHALFLKPIPTSKQGFVEWVQHRKRQWQQHQSHRKRRREQDNSSNNSTTARMGTQHHKRVKNAVITTIHQTSPSGSWLLRYSGPVNPLFLEPPVNNNNGSTRQPIVYDDSNVDFVHTWDPDEGTRAHALFLKSIPTSKQGFVEWVQHRKWQWRQHQSHKRRREHDASKKNNNNNGTTTRMVIQHHKRVKNAVTTTIHWSSPPGSCLLRYSDPVNPLFLESPDNNNNSTLQPIVYEDSNVDFAHTWDPDEGIRAHALFLKPIPTSKLGFVEWVQHRKRQWRQHQSHKRQREHDNNNNNNSGTTDHGDVSNTIVEFEDGGLFQHSSLNDDDSDDDMKKHIRSRSAFNDDRIRWQITAVPVEFWKNPAIGSNSSNNNPSSVAFASFQDWISTRTALWKCHYSWNRRNRRRLERVVHAVVTLKPHTVRQWLRVRKQQWSMQRRKRQRERMITTLMNPHESFIMDEQQSYEEGQDAVHDSSQQKQVCELIVSGCDHRKTLAQTNRAIDVARVPSGNGPFRGDVRAFVLGSNHHKPLNANLLLIDSLLDEEDQKRKALKSRPPLDLMFLFDEASGCPDDVVVHCFRFLPDTEHGKLLALNRNTRRALQSRQSVWELLCQLHRPAWKLPRRPRKPWHVLYWSMLQNEVERAQKRWDDLLTRIATILFKGDHIQAVEKLIRKAERDSDCQFDVNYSSGIVCERNSVLNLATIHGRHKVVKWLVDVKHADIESSDRGNFSPLLNAAWAGDKYLVRFLLQRGANRTVRGRYHYTTGVAPHDFAGQTAAEWANIRGHEEIANLIRLGL